MLVAINANMVDQSTSHVATRLDQVLRPLSAGLSGDYGGTMEHLRIDLELIAAHANSNGSPRYPFRFQRRVSGRSHFGLPAGPDTFNVGHFSVRPNFEMIGSLPPTESVDYALTVIYEGTHLLHSKAKRLGGFDATKFRSRFRDVCRGLGYTCGA